MKTALISVGTELLMGQTVNTNVVYLSRQLNMQGFDIIYHHTVGDNPKRLKELIELSCEDCDLIITTGGLGPTQDDLTKEIATECFHDELVLHEPSLDAIKVMFDKMGMEMADNNIKQAYLPSRATIFDNKQGTAPGMALKDGEKYIICLPGPPREMKWMYDNRVKPFLEELSGGALFFRDIRTYGIGESDLETAIIDLINNQTDPTIATYAKEGESFVRIASKRKTREEAMVAVDQMVEKVREYIGEYIYSIDGEDLKTVVARLLCENNISISCAESCTGGLFAGALIDYPGISKVFDRGLVTYSNEAKIEELGVSETTLEKYGAVSEETAAEMCQGLYKVSGSDLCISVTGIAGPEGGTEEKPVGLVYMGIHYKGETIVEEHRFRNVNRQWNRGKSVLDMMFMVYKLISKKG